MLSYRSVLARRRNRLLVGLAAGSLVLAAAGCDSTSDAGSGGGGGDLSASQQECVDSASTYLDERGLLPETLPEELAPLGAPPTPGLRFTKLMQGAIPTDVESSELMVDIANEIGWEGRTVAYDGSVEDVNRKLMDAIATSDVVSVAGPAAAAVQGPIQAAKDAGVLLLLNAPEPTESVPGYGGNPFGSADLWGDLGTPGGYQILAATNCQANVAAFGLPAPTLQAAAEGMHQVLEEECEDCEYSYTDINPSDIGSPAATNAVISRLQSDPSINFVFFTIGDLAAGIEPALRQAGLDVQVGGVLPSSPNLDALQRGADSFWVGVPQETSALLYLDTALRALESGEPYTNQVYPAPIFTQDNTTQTDPVPAYPADIKDQFMELWQVDS
jgi:ABC-type sugar transport system substrate-binding protein